MFIFLTVCHSFPLSLTYSQNFPGPDPCSRTFQSLKIKEFPGFPEPARTRTSRRCIDRLTSRLKQNCESLTYLPSPGDERLLKTGKVSVTASDVRNMHYGKKTHNFFEESGESIPKHRKICRHRVVYKNC